MIFGNNKTLLGNDIAMAEGYDCSFGPALVMVESARNDFAMFEAMLKCDYKEIEMRKSGYVNESEIVALDEAAGSGIWGKIKELFTKLIAKIKSIFANLYARLSNLWKTDKEMVKKYRPTIRKKSNLGKLEVKWRKVKTSATHDPVTFGEITDSTAKINEVMTKLNTDWKEDDSSSDKFAKVLKELGYNNYSSENESEFINDYIEGILEDEDTYELSNVGGIEKIMTFLEGYSSKLKDMNKNIKHSTSNISRVVRDFEKDMSDNYKKTGDDYKPNDATTAKKTYNIAVIYQSIMLALMSATTQIATIEYKQNKAAFMKAVTVNEKKLEEAAVANVNSIPNLVAEAAEQEVEDVITAAMKTTEIRDLSSASDDVKDGDVKDCPELGYQPNKYTDDADLSTSDGSIESDITSRNESAYFGKLMW